MPEIKADMCDYCGKATLKPHGEDSNMVKVLQPHRDTRLVLTRDIRSGELARPTFALAGKCYCPECLIKALSEWLEKSK